MKDHLVPDLKFTQAETNSSIPARFKRVVQVCPEKVALESSCASLTYSELNLRVEKIQAQIHSMLEDIPEPVALLLGYNPGIIVAILGV